MTGRPLTFLATIRSMALYTESSGRTLMTSVVMMSLTSRSSKQPCVPIQTCMECEDRCVMTIHDSVVTACHTA